jgi:transketolase
MSAAQFRLDNLTVIIDRNDLTIEGNTEENMGLEPLAEKLKAFNWFVLEVDGHSVEELVEAFDAKSPGQKPKMIIAKTIKGRGVPSVEGKASSHFFKISPEVADEALSIIQAS